MPPLFTSTASNPGFFDLSHEKLARLHPELLPGGGIWYWLSHWSANPQDVVKEIAYCLHEGDCRAAIVVSLSPLLIAAYSDEFDAVVMLRFSPRLAAVYDLSVGRRLITVNNYEQSLVSRQTDFRRGEQATGQFTGVYPLIAEFFTDDTERIAEIKRKISEEEWQRVHELGMQKLAQSWPPPRNGRPRYARYGGGEFYVAIAVVLMSLIIVALILIVLLR